MASTNFVDFSTPIVAAWLNDINGFFYALFAGATTPAQALAALGAVGSSNPSFTGNLTFPNNGSRIIGDMSTGIISDRLALQTSVLNGPTAVTSLPNGTGSYAGFQAFTSPGLNSSYVSMSIDGSTAVVTIASDRIGAGSYVPITFATSNVERMRIGADGNVAIGSNLTSNSKFYIESNIVQLRVRNSATPAGRLWSIGYVDSGSTMYMLNEASIGVGISYGGTAWFANSDERLKDIIEPISNARAKVKMLRSVIGKYKTDEAGKRRPFLIAQDLVNALPEVVSYTRLPNSDDETEYMTVEYANTIPLLVAAFNEQEDVIVSLIARIEALEA